MNFYRKILKKLKDNQKLYVLTVVENIGSSPGRQGFKMFVSEDGYIEGSIGGGIMEYQLIERAKRDLKSLSLKIYFKRQIHQGKGFKDSSGMICSGEQTIAFHPLTRTDVPILESIIDCLGNGKNGFLALSNKGFNFIEKKLEAKFSFSKSTNVDWLYKENINQKNTVYIIGAGHVALAVSKLLNSLEFSITLFDDRLNLNTFNENEFVTKKQVINYQDISNFVLKDTYIIILTTKFITDKLVLSKLIDSKLSFKYIGVLGSQAKIKTMFKMMVAEGYCKSYLDKLHAPIGYPINSQTPVEIAISIAAQVIEVKNSRLKRL